MLDDLSHLPPPSNPDLNDLALVKGLERYFFSYTDNSRAECLRVLEEYALDPDLSLTWYDVAVLSQKIRRTSGKNKEEQPKQPHRRF